MTNHNQKKQLNCDRFTLIDLSTERQQALKGGIGGDRGCTPPFEPIFTDKDTNDKQTSLVNLSLQF